MGSFALAGGAAQEVARLAAEATFQVNIFQVVIAAANFLVFLVIIWTFAFKPVTAMLNDRKARIEAMRAQQRARERLESEPNVAPTGGTDEDPEAAPSGREPKAG